MKSVKYSEIVLDMEAGYFQSFWLVSVDVGHKHGSMCRSFQDCSFCFAVSYDDLSQNMPLEMMCAIIMLKVSWMVV